MLIVFGNLEELFQDCLLNLSIIILISIIKKIWKLIIIFSQTISSDLYNNEEKLNELVENLNELFKNIKYKMNSVQHKINEWEF